MISWTNIEVYSTLFSGNCLACTLFCTTLTVTGLRNKLHGEIFQDVLGKKYLNVDRTPYKTILHYHPNLVNEFNFS